jgi:hypothetical protein
LLGWFLGMALLAGPIALIALNWHRRHGHWWYFFWQWKSLAFWLLWVGSLAAGVGIFALLGIIPAWQDSWTTWYLANLTSFVARNPTADLSALGWIATMQHQYMFALQATASLVFLLGSGAVAVAQARMGRLLATFRRAGPDDWLVAPAAEEPSPAQSANRLAHPLAH